ncbi:two-component sensor histidine kinase [Gracilibacillus boraciitolerans JCM 21714]|uniref:Two-component sensor histidine kinase n=1 Tax=Gracilibacillus boraciitolerans JCM 21714 TaxID=1298598 RepID=W4VGC3_9BACI|nr:ATP-binding protein [Gracilibacillus boraciitolerans]GAE91868.1 two-component sensor histidine kinase [Gracilibacillus boraciitolerans JCM 21714]
MKFILQPIIENCIIHGSSEEEITTDIKVKIKNKKENIRFTIIDNGKGISSKKLNSLLNELDKDQYRTNHIGLSNIKKRLSLLFGENFQFIIRSKETWGGTIIIIEHPLEHSNNQEKNYS